MVYNPSVKSNIPSASPDFPFLFITKFRNRVRSNMLLESILSQSYPVHFFNTYSFEIHFNNVIIRVK